MLPRRRNRASVWPPIPSADGFAAEIDHTGELLRSAQTRALIDAFLARPTRGNPD